MINLNKLLGRNTGIYLYEHRWTFHRRVIVVYSLDVAKCHHEILLCNRETLRGIPLTIKYKQICPECLLTFPMETQNKIRQYFITRKLKG